MRLYPIVHTILNIIGLDILCVYMISIGLPCTLYVSLKDVIDVLYLLWQTKREYNEYPMISMGAL